MNRRDAQIILKIMDEINVAGDFMEGVALEQFRKDELLKRAVCMTVINIGELIKGVSDKTRKAQPHVPWREAAGFRDIAAHKYQTLKMEDVYTTVINDFPALKDALAAIINEADKPGSL